jgi:hypothetical protein
VETNQKFARAVVATFAPEALDTYDKLTGQPLVLASGIPFELNDEQRLEVALHLWQPTDRERARPN